MSIQTYAMPALTPTAMAYMIQGPQSFDYALTHSAMPHLDDDDAYSVKIYYTSDTRVPGRDFLLRVVLTARGCPPTAVGNVADGSDPLSL